MNPVRNYCQRMELEIGWSIPTIDEHFKRSSLEIQHTRTQYAQIFLWDLGGASAPTTEKVAMHATKRTRTHNAIAAYAFIDVFDQHSWTLDTTRLGHGMNCRTFGNWERCCRFKVLRMFGALLHQKLISITGFEKAWDKTWNSFALLLQPWGQLSRWFLDTDGCCFSFFLPTSNLQAEWAG